MAKVGFAAPVVYDIRTIATVVSTHTDTANNVLYAMFAYQQPICGEYQVSFSLIVTNGGTSVTYDTIPVQEVESVSQTGVTGFSAVPAFVLQPSGRLITQVKSGGFGIKVPNLRAQYGVTRTSKVEICAHVLQNTNKCIGCGPAGSDIIFTNTDIDPSCPGLAGMQEIVACHKIKTVNGYDFWEGWIQDSRNCLNYRVVRMPDGRWWMADNLAVDGDATDYDENNMNNATISRLDTGIWCPLRPQAWFGSNQSSGSDVATACNVREAGR
jgi:hypothetical protein